MKDHQYIRLICALLAATLFSACGGVKDYVGDKLINKKSTFTETGPCDMLPSNPAWVDSDGDGLSDACELAIGNDPYDNDSDGDGLIDGFDESPPCTLSPAECASFDDQRQNALTRQGVGKDVALASSALKGESPFGTKVNITKQRFHIVLNSQGMTASDQNKFSQICRYDPNPTDNNTDDSVPLTSFLYMEVEGSIKLCTAFISTSNSGGECEGSETQSSIQLCGPLDEIAGSLGNFVEDQEYELKHFRWTRGRSGSINQFFHPNILITKKKIPDGTYNTLTLTPKDKKEDSGSSAYVFNKLKAQFTYPWRVTGIIEQKQGNSVYQYPMPSVSGIESENISIKNMKRTGTLNFSTYTGILGPYANDQIGN
ncbi:MAG: hypothetical protein KDD52_08735 [Bdellovibrionales bacterium]|nr:hypothetical protein [Bdellovibrionales bacterium]